MPGGAATTAGIALIAGIAVMIIPSTMKSANVVASKSGGGRYSSVVRTVGGRRSGRRSRASIAPIRSRVWPFRHRTFSSTTVRPSTGLPARTTPATHPAGIVHEPRIEVLGRLRVLRLADDLVELHTERVGHQPTASPNTAVPCGHPREAGVVDRPAEARRQLGRRASRRAWCRRPLDRDLVDAVADRRADAQQLDEAGAHPGAEDRVDRPSHARRCGRGRRPARGR